MKKIFIGGSRHIKHLNKLVKERLNNIINKNYQILIGDANGADKAVQQYLHNLLYHNVMVYCSGNHCRNNIGNWEVVNVTVPANLRGSKFYMVKDASMAENADYGFMLWDGKSSGTLNNVLNLLLNNKRTLIYYSPENYFYKISSLWDLEKLLSKCSDNEILEFENKINLSKIKNMLNKTKQQQAIF